jgi:hypothetical protein
MDFFDDYQDEVERLTNDQIEAILSGGDHSSRPLATMVRDVRLDLLEDPSPEITARHLGAMARAARPSELGPAAAPAAMLGRRRVLPRRRLTAMGLAAALLLVGGLAAAVTLPKKVVQPTEDTVPSTAPSVAPTATGLVEEAAHGRAVADVAKDPSLTGCEKGQAVADVASAKAAENREGPAEKNDPCARAGAHGKPKSVSRGPVPNGPSGGPKGLGDSHPAGGAGSSTTPGPGNEGPGVSGSEASGGGAGGGVGAGGLGGREAGAAPRPTGGGVPEDLPMP